MKRLLFTAVMTVCVLAMQAQKATLDLEAIKNWPEIRNEVISNDGKYVMYTIHKNEGEDTLVIQPVDSRWVDKITGVKYPVITESSRHAIFLKNDSLYVYDLKLHKIKTGIGNIQSYKIPLNGNGQWLACLDKSREKKLLLCDLFNNKNREYKNAGFYRFSENGEILLLQTNTSDVALLWIDLKQAKTDTIMHNAGTAGNYAFDQSAMQLAFTAGASRKASVWYYKKGMDSAVIKINGTAPGINSQLNVAPGAVRFSPDGKRLFFTLKKKTDGPVKKDANNADVNVWHYDDDYLQTEQAVRLSGLLNRSYTAVLHLNENKIFQIDQESDDRFFELPADGNGDYALVKQSYNFFAGHWKASNVSSHFLVNINTGERKNLLSQRDITISMSPAGKYVIWYDPVKKTWFTYETGSGVVKDITPQLTGTLTPTAVEMRSQPVLPVGIAGWLPNDLAVLIYDEFDVWKIDPGGKKAPVNITNGYGKRHHLMLRNWGGDNRDYAAPVINNEELLLVVFDTQNKNNGFFKTTLTSGKDPVLLSIGPYMYYSHMRFDLMFHQKYTLVKAKNASVYLLRRMSAREYPNIYCTHDFRKYSPISNLHPENHYNWLTTELISCQKNNGDTSQGILYKPENFDPRKKYPIIFYFYERLSQRLNEYMEPDLSDGSINIPFYVSNGYLVCTPDISYTLGSPGESAYQSVLLAARHLSQMPWVDSMRMGLQGHSFGGYQVNYIVSRTNLFTAAQESAGASDFVSYYNSFYREHSAQFYFEEGQGRLEHTLWGKPELYLQNSPIFRADQVETPLLMMHNKDDGEVPFQQGIEWFTALRRLGKKVWMLQYDKEYHGIVQPKNKADFTIRVMQFFDHYLKGAPEPKWMVNGIPASLKGVETGLELMPGSSTAAGK